ncbi:type IV secretory system conjugative DNA transfer family protein [Flavobacterium sp. J27]|uniref:type IV secretory system conjugative DNA transfer family protein n=1 Tax=Flavobacterium sp. J27 TaxID=2060419 RepID=UPI001031620A|nr:type IV secretion system DNA-binding domain-containing protein [Flavobacterium sp. J27]
MGELGIIFKIIKAIFIYVSVFAVVVIEIHIIGFGFSSIFIDKYEFKLRTIKENYIPNIYNNFLYFFSKPYEKQSLLVSLSMTIFILAIIYISYYFSKRKKFPGVILGTIINNTIIIIPLVFIFSLLQKNLKDYKQLIAIIFLIVPLLFASYLIKFKRRNKKSKKEQFEKIKKSEKEITENFVFQTKSGTILLENPYRGIYIQGGAGSGKSASVFEPIIQQIGQKGFTGILYDFKSPELTEKIYISYENTSVKVVNIDFKQPLFSERVNPIDPKYLVKSAIVLEYSQVVINNLLPESIKKPDYWSSNAKMILAGVIWFLRNEHPQYCTLPHAISLILHNSADSLIAKISQDYEAGGMVASLRESIERGAERTVAGMLSTLQNALSTLNSHDLFWILSSNDVDLHLNNKENPTFLCLGNDSTLPTTYTPAISLIITVALRQMNQPNQVKSVILLDEAPTIFIPNIEQIPATARSNKIATIFGVQDYAQLSDKYGEEKAQVIISNLGNQFFGRITNGKTAEMVQNLFSKTDKVFVSKSEGTGTSGKVIHLGSNTNQGTSENIQERNRVKISDLVNLSQGEFYGIIAEGTPREFLKTQFLRNEIKGTYVNQKLPINNDIMKENYIRIVNECKEIIG